MRGRGYILFLAIASTLLVGCRSTLILEKKRFLQQFPHDPIPVFVTNPEMKREYGILQGSGIFVLTSDTNCTRRVTLNSLQEVYGCGNGIILSLATVGVIPVIFETGYGFSYDIETADVVMRRDHSLRLYSRVSIWEWLIKKRDEKQMLVKALTFSKLFTSTQPPTEPVVAPQR